MKTKQKKPVETADLRFKDALPLQKYRKLTIGIAGLGAVGRQVAILLATMGHKKLYGADPDKIELKNVGTQGWSPSQVKQYKAATLRITLNSRSASFTGLNLKFENVMDDILKRTDVFFCCVDKMQAREAIWNTIISPTYLSTEGYPEECLQGLWIDARMTTRVIRIITIPLADSGAKEYYSKTLYTDAEAFDGACTDRMTMYGANIAAGLMVSQLANWLNGIPLMRDFVFETQRMSSVPIEMKNGNKNKIKKE